MPDVFEQPDGATPLTPAEMRDLIPAYISSRSELNDAEQQNILRGQDWALGRRRDMLCVKHLAGSASQLPVPELPILVVPQGRHRIHEHGAPYGHRTRHEGHTHQHGDGAGDCRRVVRRHANK